MDAMHVVLLALALLAGAAAVWFGMKAARLGAEAVSADTRAVKAEGEGEALRAEVSRLAAVNNAHENRVIALEKDVEAARAQHESEARRVEEVARANIRAVEERERRMKEDFALFEAKMRESFTALAGDALKSSTDGFLKLAGETLSKQTQAGAGELEQRKQAIDARMKPVEQTLDQTRLLIEQLKVQRAAADARLETTIGALASQSERLGTSTEELVNLLQRPKALGDWGEQQLRRVAEMAQMKDYCDFEEQVPVKSIEGEDYRPDMLVKLPDGLRLAVDAKASLTAFAKAVRANSESEREDCLKQHAVNVGARVRELGRKSYYTLFPGSPQMTILFLPGEQFLDRAMSQNPSLVEEAASVRVVFATPSSLIALIRVAALAWHQREMAEQSEALRKLGVELHTRVLRVMEHAADLGKDLRSAVGHYNDFVGSAERNLLSTARKFESVQIAGCTPIADAKLPDMLDVTVREPKALPAMDAGGWERQVAKAATPPRPSHQGEGAGQGVLLGPATEQD